jgi:hypothetical protein
MSYPSDVTIEQWSLLEPVFNPPGNPTEGRAYYDRRKADGKTSMEAMRALKRRLSNIVYKAMLDDAITMRSLTRRRAREGNGATTLTPARPAHIPTPALRTSHFPDPPPPILEPRSRPHC